MQGCNFSQAQSNQYASVGGPTKPTRQVWCPARCAIICTTPNRGCSPRSPFTAAHSTARPSLLALHTHPSQSLSFAARHHTRFCFVVCPSELLFTNSQRAAPFLPFTARRNQGVNPKLHSGPHYPRPQRTAFRIWQLEGIVERVHCHRSCQLGLSSLRLDDIGSKTQTTHSTPYSLPARKRPPVPSRLLAHSPPPSGRSRQVKPSERPSPPPS